MTTKKDGGGNSENKGSRGQSGVDNSRKEQRSGYAISFDKPTPPAKPKTTKK